MTLRWTQRIRRVFTVAGGTAGALIVLAVPAAAHTPVILDSTDTVPATAPLVVNGDDPVAFFGVVTHAGADRAFQFNMTAGQTVSISTLVPDLAPENQLGTNCLPVVLVIDPKGHVTVVSPTMRTPVPIPELNENYLLINAYTAPAVTGTYSVVVTGLAPARFNVSIGTEGGDFHGILRGQVATVEQIQQWYATAP
jgi:hypothetical protein